jgi:hypothetical protein
MPKPPPWFDELVKAIERECFRHNQHPGGGVLEVDPDQLKVSLPLSDGSRFPREYENGLGERTPLQAAADYYDDYLKLRQPN